MSKYKYICKDCQKSFSLKAYPSYCPYCGGKSIAANKKKSEIHAHEIITQMKELLPEVEIAWEAYTYQYVTFEALRQKAVVYARRGIIKESDIPVLRKTKLADSLREYRSVTPSTPNPNPDYKPPIGKRDKMLEDIIAGKGLSHLDPNEKLDENNLPPGICIETRG